MLYRTQQFDLIVAYSVLWFLGATADRGTLINKLCLTGEVPKDGHERGQQSPRYMGFEREPRVSWIIGYVWEGLTV